MNINRQNKSASHDKNRHQRARPEQSGSVLIYIVVVMLIFGFLGSGMISMFTSSTMMSSGVPNYAKRSEYLAESGMRYAISELRNTGYSTSTLSTLNSTTYTLDDAGSFTVNVFGKWFEADPSYSSGSGTLTLITPQGEFPSSTISTDDFDIPTNAWVVNLESYRDAFIFSGTPDTFTAEIQNVVYSSINIDLTDTFEANQDERVCLAVRSSSDQSVASGGNLDLPDEAQSFFPEKYGSFYVTDTMDEKKLYFYEVRTEQPNVQLTGLSEAVTVNTNDYVILSPRNHMIVASGTSGTTSSGGENYHAANYRQNILTPQDVAPPAMDLPADIAPASISDFSTPAESAGGAVEVGVDAEGNPIITLGGGVGSAFGSVWYGGTTTRGGVNVCVDGKCDFNRGMRAFFIMDYQGTGDGFTFAIVNGSNNTTSSTGGSGAFGELLGYAGDGNDGNGIQAPKMAIEFDTYINPGAYDPSTGSGRNDQGSSDLDHLQFVFWGDTADDKFDDNVHGFDGMRKKWEYSTATEGTGNVKSSPAIDLDPDGDPDGDTIYIGSDNGRVYAFTHSGSIKSGWPYTTDGSVKSSPAVDPVDNRIYVGSDDGYFYSLNSDGSLNYRYHSCILPLPPWPALPVCDKIESSPVIADDGYIYIGSKIGYLYAFDRYQTSASGYYFPFDPAEEIKSSPAVSGNNHIYIGSNSDDVWDANLSPYGYSILKATRGDVVTRPAIGDDGTVYVGSKDGIVYAIDETTGTLDWWYNTGGSIESSPAIGSDGTIYIGSDSDNLYALDPDPSAERVKWSFLTDPSSNVRSSPTFDDGFWDEGDNPLIEDDRDGDETIWFGADNHNLYALNPANGEELGSIDLGGNVRPKPAIGSDGMVYIGSDDDKVFAITPHCSLENIKDIATVGNAITPDNLTTLGDPINVSGNPNNWLNEGRYWAVRMEVVRSTTENTRGKYEYTLKAWIRQCSTSTCATDWNGSRIVDTYFADTRIEYSAKTPHLEQTVEFCSADHTKFKTALIGFTEATGGETQNVIIQKLAIGLIRPGDDEITYDPW